MSLVIMKHPHIEVVCKDGGFYIYIALATLTKVFLRSAFVDGFKH